MTARTQPSVRPDHPPTAAWRRLRDVALAPGDPGYDAARAPWNRAAEHHPALVVPARDVADVRAAVDHARATGTGLGVLATGHGTGRPCDGVLVTTGAMRDVRVDPSRRLARVGAGARWTDVVGPAAAHGLAGLVGSSPHVGVVGYTLGGGFGWLGRRHGLAVHSVTRAEVVTADGRQRVADREQHPDLFWGLLGSAGALGVVTALEFRLHPVAEVYAGNLYYPLDRTRVVLDTFRAWSGTVPDELTAAVTFRRFPAAPSVRLPLRGGSWVAVRGCWSGPLEDGRALVDRLRGQLGRPEVDTFGPIRAADLGTVSQDPVDPVPATNHSLLIRDLTPAVVDELVRLAGPAARSPLVMLELRQLGGALAGPPGALSPLAHTRARFSLNAVGLTPDPELRGAVRRHLATLDAALAPHSTRDSYLNFLDLDGATAARTRASFTDADWQRLVELKARYDPQNLFRFHRIPELADTPSPLQKAGRP